MKKLLLATAVIAGLMVTSSANAATPPITIDEVTYWGYTVSTSDGWRFLSCTADGYNASWQKIAHSDSLRFFPGWQSGSSDNTGHGEWIELDTDGVVHATVECSLERDTVRYEQRWRWFTKVRDGVNPSSRSSSRRCSTSKTFGDLQLDCWGGSYARATYSFSLPRDARQVTRRIVGGNRCCMPGTLIRRWSGNKAIVQVGGWKSFYVEKVWTRYQHRAPTAVPVTETGTNRASY